MYVYVFILKSVHSKEFKHQTAQTQDFGFRNVFKTDLKKTDIDFETWEFYRRRQTLVEDTVLWRCEKDQKRGTKISGSSKKSELRFQYTK